MPDGTWEAFMADRFPEQLDDEIKKKHKDFYMAAQHLDPEELMEELPMTLPVTHLLNINGVEINGVAKYPLDEWEKQGQPMITTSGWIKLCMKICAKDMKNLENVYTMAVKLSPKL